MNKAILDYVTGKMSHEEFEAETYIDPAIWEEIQALVPADIKESQCPFRTVYGRIGALEANNYSVKATLTAIENYSLTYDLISKLVKYQNPEIVCREPLQNAPEDLLESIHMDYIGGVETDDCLREIMAEYPKKGDLRKKLKEFFPCSPRKHPEWVQEPEWPAMNGRPMKFISQKNDGELFTYEFQDVESGQVVTITQYA